MPKIDSITGCSVLTFPEFIVSSAKNEGKEPYELIEEMYNEIAEDQKNEEIRLKADLDGALNILLDDMAAAPEYYDDNGFKPVRVIEVFDTNVNYNFRRGKTVISVRVECDDGKERIATCTAASSSGNFYEPPDYECAVEWR